MLAHDIRFTPLASVTMLLLLLFTVAAQAANFNISIIPSDPHHQYTTDTSLLVWPWRSYKTSHHHPPHMKITRPNRKPLAPGYIFISPANSNNEDGTYELSGTGFIMDYVGDLVYAAEETGMDFCDAWIGGMTDFRAQEFNGKKVITYWNGCNHKGQHWGHRWGRVTFIDEEYDNFTMNPDIGINTLDDAPRGQIDVHGESKGTWKLAERVSATRSRYADQLFIHSRAPNDRPQHDACHLLQQYSIRSEIRKWNRRRLGCRWDVLRDRPDDG